MRKAHGKAQKTAKEIKKTRHMLKVSKLHVNSDDHNNKNNVSWYYTDKESAQKYMW